MEIIEILVGWMTDLMTYAWSKLPFISVCLSLVFKEEIQAWWKGLRAKYVNNTYPGSIHKMKSHNFGVGEYVAVEKEKARGKGAGCHILYINSGRRGCLPWTVYAQYEFQEVTGDELDACRKAIVANKNCAYRDRITVESFLGEKGV